MRGIDPAPRNVERRRQRSRTGNAGKNKLRRHASIVIFRIQSPTGCQLPHGGSGVYSTPVRTILPEPQSGR